MGPNNILYYNDDHQVTITETGIKVKKTLYRLNGISRHGLSVISPPRIPFLVLIGIGTCLFIMGAMNLIPASWSAYINFYGFPLKAVSLFMISGLIFIMTGILVMLRLREKYAVQIITAEGEKNVVVSRSREYIAQIVDALNRAFLDLMTSRSKEERKS